MRWSWVNFQCRGVLLIWMIVGQGPIALAVGAGGGCLDIFTLNYPFFLLSPSLWETARYRLKYCLKRPLNPRQPTNQQSGLSIVDILTAQIKTERMLWPDCADANSCPHSKILCLHRKEQLVILSLQNVFLRQMTKYWSL